MEFSYFFFFPLNAGDIFHIISCCDLSYLKNKQLLNFSFYLQFLSLLNFVYFILVTGF